jgi:hypothetical protein
MAEIWREILKEDPSSEENSEDMTVKSKRAVRKLIDGFVGLRSKHNQAPQFVFTPHALGPEPTQCPRQRDHRS